MTRDDEFCAWCELAMLCEGPLDWRGFLKDPALDDAHGGICPMLQHDKMETRLHKELPGLNNIDPYWPCTRSGWTARARFCWRMARLCEGESQT